MGIREVAALAGVSTTTVSHALSGRRAVSPATQQRVDAAVAELGYRPSAVARSLRTQRTHTVALLVPDIANPFYPAVARGLQDAVAAQDLFTVVGSTDGDRGRELGFVEEMLARQVDGLVLFTFALDDTDLQRVVGERTHLVVASGGVTDRYDTVTSDDAHGVEEAATYLLSQGIQDVAFVSGPEGVGPGDGRLAGFTAALRRVGMTTEGRVARGPYTVAGGQAAVTALLSGPSRPAAVVCANDLMAVGALRAAAEAGLRVPEDVAVVGFDDIDAAALVTPGLTTVRNPAYELGRRCGQTLLGRISGTDVGPPRDIQVPTDLVVRGSA